MARPAPAKATALPRLPAWLPESLPRRRLASRHAQHQPLVPVAIAVGLGVVADRFSSLGAGWWVAAAAGGAGWALLARRRAPAPRLAAAVLLVAVAATAAAWHHGCWRLFGGDDLGFGATAESEPICFDAVALDAPQRRGAPRPTPLRAIPQGEKTDLRVRVVRVRDGSDWRPASGRLDVLVDGNLLAIHAGDRVRVFGQARAAGPAMNPGQFDFAADARADRQLATVCCESPDCVTLLRAGSRWAPWRWLTDSRTWIERRLRRRLGDRRSPLAAAMLVGARRAVARDRAEAFRRTGALHVLVVSGLHVGLVVGVIYAAARLGWFPRRATLVVVMLLILGYAMLTGARPPVVRAAVLAEVMCLAAIFGRPVLAINSLAAAAVVVLAINPAELFRSGTQLSFIAAATLIWFGNLEFARRQPDAIERLLASVRPWPVRALRGATRWAGLVLLATIVVWVATAPLLMCRFHLIAPVAAPISLAVFPLVAVIVTSGLLLVAAEVVAPFAAPAIAPCCGLAIEGLQGVIDAANEPALGPVWLAGPAVWWTVGAYGLMGAGLVAGAKPGAAKRLTQAGLAWVIAGFLSAALNDQRPTGLRCSFLSVGHGCSVLVETPGGATLLYDAGSLSAPEAAAETIAGVLWSRGVERIDALVLSHADIDHFNAVPGLMERFGVGGVYTSEAMFAGRDEPGDRSAPAELLRAIRGRGVPINVLRQGDRLEFDGASALVLHPLGESVSDNAGSLVLAIDFRGRRVLLPGDLEGPGLADLTFQRPCDCDLLLAPHHGSARSDPPGFADWSSPEWVVVSGGSGAYSRSAGESYRESGARLFRTFDSGCVEIVLNRQSTVVECFHKRRGGQKRSGPATVAKKQSR